MNEALEMEDMFYVAADPKQPGAAFAICADDPSHLRDTAENVADWIRSGAKILRLDRKSAVEMLNRWKRPQRQAKSTCAQAALL
ncbi:MAG TPA: hypothetical protein VFM97_00355 [Gammaproteobacteria bacterium]|nr:hypothetical protein [Gammaproteobacteria bacterium]